MRSSNQFATKSLSLALIVLGALTACGGGGGGQPAPPPAPAPPIGLATPVANLSMGAKQLIFSWVAVSGATSYRLLRNADGVSGFTQVGADFTAATLSTSLEIPVHLTDWLNARYQIHACNSIGCTTSADLSAVTGSQAATAYVKASNTGASDFFGTKVVISRDGSTLAVSAPAEDSNAQLVGGNEANDLIESAGAVYVYVRDSAGQWAKQAYIKASNPGIDDRFGYSLAISADGNTLAVGSAGEDSAAKTIDGNDADDSATNAGAVYVYLRVGQTWSKQAYVKAGNAEESDYFGEAVALSGDGNYLAVGAIREDSATGINGDPGSNFYVDSGAVFVYRRTGTTWAPEAYLKAVTNLYPDNQFGSALAFSNDGRTLAVASQNESAAGATAALNSMPASGAVYVFVSTAGVWTQQAYLKASNARSGLLFGDDVALSSDGNILAVGATADSSAATGVGGIQTGTGALNSGAVYVYTRSNGVWGSPVYIKALNAGAQDLFGGAVALNTAGDILAVGAINESSPATGINGDGTVNTTIQAGAVYVFVRTGEQWAQRSYVKPKVADFHDKFGASIALNGSGQTLAVGSFDASNATNVGGDAINNLAFSSGAVQLY